MSSWNRASDLMNNIRLTFYAFVGFPLLGFAAVFFKARQGGFNGFKPGFTLGYEWVLILLAFAAALTGYLYYLNKIKKARKLVSLRAKMNALFNASFTKFMLFELGLLIILTCYALHTYQGYAVAFITLLLTFVANNPSPRTPIYHLQLPRNEANTIRRNEPIA